MRESTTSFLFPDVNVWLALSYESHVHHEAAKRWFDGVPATARICFCRVTQIALLRLLTTEKVMQATEALTQREAWRIYDSFLLDDRIIFSDEPAEVEEIFRAASQSGQSAPKDWTDSYLIAFATAGGFQLVTFDKALKRRTDNAILLGQRD